MKRVYTAAEKRAIDAAWDDLETLTEGTQWGGLTELKRALKAERHEGGGEVTWARVQLIRHVVDGAFAPRFDTREIKSIRSGCMYAISLGADFEHRFDDDQQTDVDKARKAIWIRLRDERGPAAFFAREAEQRRRIG